MKGDWIEEKVSKDLAYRLEHEFENSGKYKKDQFYPSVQTIRNHLKEVKDLIRKMSKVKASKENI
jgi:hypothetical protein